MIENFYYDGGDDGIALKSGMCDVSDHARLIGHASTYSAYTNYALQSGR